MFRCSNRFMARTDNWVNLMKAYADFLWAQENFKQNPSMRNRDRVSATKSVVRLCVDIIGPNKVRQAMGREDAKRSVLPPRPTAKS
jgi:hypothetical protein